MSPRLSAVRPVLILVSLALFIGTGLRNVWETRSSKTAFALGPMVAVEMHADYGAGRPGALAELAPVLARLPQGTPIIVFHAETNTRGWMVADVLRYLAWPRPVEHAETPGADGRSLAQLQEKYAAVVLCGQK